MKRKISYLFPAILLLFVLLLKGAEVAMPLMASHAGWEEKYDHFLDDNAEQNSRTAESTQESEPVVFIMNETNILPLKQLRFIADFTSFNMAPAILYHGSIPTPPPDFC